MDRNLNDLIRILNDKDEFLVTAHENPDGDAVGSMAAMGGILDAMGKRYVVFNGSGMPERLAWMKMPSPLQDDLGTFQPQCMLVLDCGARDRAGKIVEALMEHVITVNIDHHLGNSMFGHVNWVEPTMSSVGEMIGTLALALDVPLSGGIGQGIFLAMVSDTGSFSYGNTRPETLDMASAILRLGLDLNWFTGQMERQSSLAKIRLQGEVLRRAELLCGGRVAMIAVSLNDFATTGARAEDCEGLVNQVRSIRGVDVAVSLREDEPRKVKFSLRSWGEVDVRRVAEAFGGGGHRNASGGAIQAPLAQARDAMVRTLDKTLAN